MMNINNALYDCSDVIIIVRSGKNSTPATKLHRPLVNAIPDAVVTLEVEM